MGFTPEEIEESVTSIVLSSVRRPYDTLGTRRVDVSFSDTQEAAAGLFLTTTSAPFYIAFLGAQRLLDAVAAEVTIVESILDCIDAMGRSTFPIRDLTPLGNARSALFELEAAVSNRDQNFKSIETVPAFQRFQANLQDFLNKTGPNVKAGGEVVQTPHEARAALGALLSQLKESHQNLVRQAVLLAGALEDFAKVNLPSLAASGVIAKARQLVDADMAKLEGLGEQERLEVIRPVILNLLTSKAVVKKYGSFLVPPTFLTLTGTGLPYADASHPAGLGGVTGDKKGPFVLVPKKNTVDLRLDAVVTAKVTGTVNSITQFFSGPQLLPFKANFNRVAGSFITDGVIVGDVIYVMTGPNASTRWTVSAVAANVLEAFGTSATVAVGSTSVQIWAKADESIPLANSYLASIDGSAREPFLVDASNEDFSFYTDAVQVAGTLTNGAARTAAQICTDINTRISALGLSLVLIAEPYLSPLKYEGVVDVTLGISAVWTLQVGKLNGLSIEVGDLVQVLSGPDQGEVFTISLVDTVGDSTFVQTTTVGVTASTGVQIQIGPAGRKVRVKYREPEDAIPNRQSLTVDSALLYAGSVLLLSWPSGAVFTSRPTHARDVVVDYNSKAQKTQAESVRVPVSELTTFRTRADLTNVAVLYRFRGVGNVVGGITSLELHFSTAASGVVLGDKLVLRTGQSAEAVWTIGEIFDDYITATGPQNSVTESGIEFEIGPDLTITQGMLLSVPAGPNIGDYYIQGARPIPFEMLLDGIFPIYKDAFSSPVLFTAALVEEEIRFSSKTTLIHSRATVNGFGAGAFNTIVPFSGAGTTTWFKLPTKPQDLRAGDFLDLYESDYQTVSESFGVLTTELDQLLIQLDHGIDTTASYAFGDAPPPFARMRSGRVYDFSGLNAALLAWAARSEQQPSYFIDLNRFINPLLVSENPTSVQIGDARTKVLALAGQLNDAGASLASSDPALTLAAGLSAYNVPPLPEVDALLRSFREKGSDRAIDLLLEGQFTTFFSLDIDEASYLGDMQKKMREMAREDLPVRKTGREDANASKLVAAIDDTDFEYAQDDLGDVQIDPPPEQLDE